MRVLIYFTEFGSSIGGGEILPLSLIATLQKSHEVVLALDKKSVLEGQPERYGILCDLSKIRIEVLEPVSAIDRFLDRIFHHFRFRRLKQIAGQCDVCISAANMIDFGRTGIHFIYMTIFDDAFREYVRHQPPRQVKRRVGVVRLTLKILGRLLFGKNRSASEIICDENEHIYPNSQYIKGLMESYYKCKVQSVFYPPTLFRPFVNNASGREGVAYVGRINAEKKIIEMIRIVERARGIAKSEIRLDIAGVIFDTPYVDEIKAMIKSRPWVTLVGPLVGEKKAKFLACHKFAVHTLRDEAFGISITEYLKSGIVCVVPNEGGAMEVVNQPRLTYASDEEAAAILAKLVTDNEFYEAMQYSCADRGSFFTSDRYLTREKELLGKLLSMPPSCNKSATKDC